MMRVYYVPDNYMNDWERICKKYCDVMGYTLIFVNNTSLGFENSKGQLIHMNIQELEESLGGNSL